MGQPAAKQGDRIMAMDTHLLANGVAVTLPFVGMLAKDLSRNVKIMGQPAATQGSGAINSPAHPGGVVASNQGTVFTGSATVTINGKPAARAGDTAQTCNQAGDLPIGKVVATGTVMIG